MITDDIRAELKRSADGPYRQFQAKLLPTVDPSRIIGVRTPALKSMARQFSLREDAGEFLDALPHEYFDEDQLHAFMISLIKDFGECIRRVEAFLPFIDNWATCDQLSPKVFSKHKAELLPRIMEWIASDDTYTVRFGI
ncbi:MAG: DNA alkylation repair protein, partial [Eubacteriaceae bacterium]|nr:DNA alkylation repair protein [Eubacteriaceae bacterium]